MIQPPNEDTFDMITAYALGALEPDEMLRMSALLEAQPELRTLVAELRATADILPYALPDVEPPADLRQRVLDRATGRGNRASVTGQRVQRWRTWALSLGGVAAVIALAAAIGWGQLLETQSQLVALQAQLTTSQQSLAQTQAQVVEAQRVVASLQGDTGKATILQVRSGETVLMAQLPPLAANRVYQLWRIQGNDAPVSAGTFTVDQRGFTAAQLPALQANHPGDTMAVTDEPAGGSTAPTTSPLIVGTSLEM